MTQPKIIVRQENELDHDAVAAVIVAAYKDVAYSNKREHLMVERLRHSDAFIPELSLVAEAEHGRIVGHILLTKISIQDKAFWYPGLALAPLSIHPAFQNKGIGGMLIHESHTRAKALGYTYIVVIGHSTYYPRFGYEPMHTYNIALPIKVVDANAMIIPLVDNGLSDISGMVNFSKAFFE